MTSPQRAPRVCRICKAKKKACGKELPTCSYCFKRGFDCVYDNDSDTPPINDNAEEIFKPWSLTLFPMAISATTLDRTMAYHMHYLYKVVGQSPAQAGKRFLDNFQRWLPTIAPRRLHEHIELSEQGLPGADVSVLLLSICLVTLRSGGDLEDPLLQPSAVHVTVKTLHAQVQAIMHASIPLVQAGVILSAYEYATGQIDSAYISIAACIRMAQFVSVDVAYERLDAVQEEKRLQATSEWNLWWSIIVLERFISLECNGTGFRAPIAACPRSDVPLPSDTESNGEYIPTYCTMSPSTIQSSSGLSSFGRQAQAIYLLDRCLNETSQSEQGDAMSQLSQLQQLDKDLQERLSAFMTQTPHEPGLRCGTIATVIRSLYILHEKILSIASSLSIEFDRDGRLKISEAALETITKIMIDVAKHHLDYIARAGVDSLAFCCACNLRVATRHIEDRCKHGFRRMSQINPSYSQEGARDGNDLDKPLFDIGAQQEHPSITTQLVKIQSANVPHQKSLQFLENLRCLYFEGEDHSKSSTPPTLRLATINAFTQRNYVALSYTWSQSPEEIYIPDGGFLVEDLKSGNVEPSSVRDAVFSRIKRYMDHVNCKYLWIDKHCIDQEEGEENQAGMQAMDRVYSLSKHPAALLSLTISTSDQVQLLADILSGRFVTREGKNYVLSSAERALDALQLLHYITSDLWFTRGWTYQENYRANMKMTLLIMHPAALNHGKSARHFGSLDGELLISSAGLYEQATKLCLAYSNHQPPPPHLDSILSRAKRYTILLANDENSAPVSMSPSIIEDIASRNLEREWDRLAIIANCCQYTNRLNSAQLQADKHSLSLSILTLILMNGEILSNSPRDKPDAGRMTLTELLHKHFFYGLDSPWKKARLTFNKSCRLANVVLTKEGVRTEGYLWRLDDEIRTADFHNNSRSRGKKRYQQLTKRPLDWLAEQLASQYPVLSERLYEILDLEVPSSAAEEWLLSMVDKVEEAIVQGKLLCTATLLGSGPLGVAVLVQPDDSENESSGTGSEMSLDRDEDCYVFTSFQRAQTDRGGFDLNDLDKHVSLEVDYDPGKSNVRIPPLHARRWIHDLTSSFVIMFSRNIFTGTVVLLAAGLADAGPCRPSSIASSSTVVASVSETATSTDSIDATQTATTATESESESETETTVIVETTPTVSPSETTTTALIDTTTTAPAITTAETTTEATATTAAATTTTEGPEAVQSISIYALGSTDPALTSTQGEGYAVLSDTQIPDVEYISFTTDSSSQLFFTLGERSGKVKIGNGPNVGKLVGYFSTGDYSLLIAVDGAIAEENGVSPVDCETVEGNGGQVLQCQYGDQGNADFWMCDGKFTFVRPGYDFTSKCPRADDEGIPKDFDEYQWAGMTGKRRVKCDETKPSCRRCLFSKVSCLGYPIGAPPGPSLRAAEAALVSAHSPPRSPTSSVDRYVYLTCTILSQGPRRAKNESETSFWSHAVPQMIHLIPAVQAAAAAFGASYDEHMLRSREGLATTRHYHRALRLVQNEVSDLRNGPFPVAVACLLMGFAETLQQRSDRGYMHLQGALTVMATRGNSAAKSPMDGGGLATLFEKLNLHSVTYATSLDIPFTGGSSKASLALVSPDLALYSLLHASYRFVSSAFPCKYAHPTQISSDLLIEQGRCRGHLQQWLSSNQLNPQLSISDPQNEQLLVLRMQCYTAFIYVSNALQPFETAYDHYALEFQEIIASAKAVLDIRSNDEASNSLPLFTPEMGIIQSLFLATLKYRHSFWRKKALNLLRKSGREGPWCGDIEAQILEVVIAAEENTFVHLSSTLDESQQTMPYTDVPEHQRVHLCLVQDYLDRRYESITLDKGAGSPARFAKVQLCKCRDLEGMLSDETRGPQKDFWADERYWDTWHKNVLLP
ncbi:transcriptional regulatory moc3 [Fusarium mexicanum]|uniref:Transcriptional regulatory moc3 n=1 Tax=Fusarium mexicanum TaxID=751941 RepID=A0A8H5IAE6_9HYPO|nr:transcriptional regulatory moc3 [Fusarium mexicanum]